MSSRPNHQIPFRLGNPSVEVIRGSVWLEWSLEEISAGAHLSSSSQDSTSTSIPPLLPLPHPDDPSLVYPSDGTLLLLVNVPSYIAVDELFSFISQNVEMEYGDAPGKLPNSTHHSSLTPIVSVCIISLIQPPKASLPSVSSAQPGVAPTSTYSVLLQTTSPMASSSVMRRLSGLPIDGIDETTACVICPVTLLQYNTTIHNIPAQSLRSSSSSPPLLSPPNASAATSSLSSSSSSSLSRHPLPSLPIAFPLIRRPLSRSPSSPSSSSSSSLLTDSTTLSGCHCCHPPPSERIALSPILHSSPTPTSPMLTSSSSLSNTYLSPPSPMPSSPTPTPTPSSSSSSSSSSSQHLPRSPHALHPLHTTIPSPGSPSPPPPPPPSPQFPTATTPALPNTTTSSTPTLTSTANLPASSPSSSSSTIATITTTSSSSSSTPQFSASVLTTCPICLESLGCCSRPLIVVYCSHTFHLDCLSLWKGSSCPLCRYYLAPAPAAVCSDCGTTSPLWMCLICGHVGCGRYAGGHARAHYDATQHALAVDSQSQRVWDYVSDTFVHRLIRSKDGELIVFETGSFLDDEGGGIEALMMPTTDGDIHRQEQVSGRGTTNGNLIGDGLTRGMEGRRSGGGGGGGGGSGSHHSMARGLAISNDLHGEDEAVEGVVRPQPNLAATTTPVLMRNVHRGDNSSDERKGQRSCSPQSDCADEGGVNCTEGKDESKSGTMIDSRKSQATSSPTLSSMLGGAFRSTPPRGLQRTYIDSDYASPQRPQCQGVGEGRLSLYPAGWVSGKDEDGGHEGGREKDGRIQGNTHGYISGQGAGYGYNDGLLEQLRMDRLRIRGGDWSIATKLEDIISEYNYTLTTQMTQQRQQYVALIAKAKAAREPILNELRKQVESTRNKVAELKSSTDQLTTAAAKDETTLRSLLEKTKECHTKEQEAKKKSEHRLQLQDRKRILSMNREAVEVSIAEAELRKRTEEIAELEQTLKDLNFTLNVQKKIKKSPLKNDLVGGKIYMGP